MSVLPVSFSRHEICFDIWVCVFALASVPHVVRHHVLLSDFDRTRTYRWTDWYEEAQSCEKFVIYPLCVNLHVMQWSGGAWFL